MADKPKLSRALIVEGKYDKIKLGSLVDGLIIPTDGFRIFSDKQTRLLIRRLSARGGVAVLTDSDRAGFLIRKHLASFIPPDKIINVYIPDIPGKESRKGKPSKEGKLGVEGIPAAALMAALEKAGLFDEDGDTSRFGQPITKADLFEAGLSGGQDSRALRAAVIKELNLPERLSAPAMPAVLSRLISRDEFLALCARLKLGFEVNR